MGLYSRGLIIGRITKFAPEIWGLIFGRAYFWEGLLAEFYGIYSLCSKHNETHLEIFVITVIICI